MDYQWNAETIRGLRKFLRLSQSAFSKQLGVRQQTVSEWETGVYEPRGASTTLLSMVATGAGYGLVERLESEAQPAPAQEPEAPKLPSRFAEPRPESVPDSRLVRRYDRAFPPHAPSTERIAGTRNADTPFRASSSAYADSAPTGPIARREVPM